MRVQCWQQSLKGSPELLELVASRYPFSKCHSLMDSGKLTPTLNVPPSSFTRLPRMPKLINIHVKLFWLLVLLVPTVLSLFQLPPWLL